MLVRTVAVYSSIPEPKTVRYICIRTIALGQYIPVICNGAGGISTYVLGETCLLSISMYSPSPLRKYLVPSTRVHSTAPLLDEQDDRASLILAWRFKPSCSESQSRVTVPKKSSAQDLNINFRNQVPILHYNLIFQKAQYQNQNMMIPKPDYHILKPNTNTRISNSDTKCDSQIQMPNTKTRISNSETQQEYEKDVAQKDCGLVF